MDSHHFGWNPGVISELAKAAFTEENREACLDSLPYEIAVRRFGAEAAPKALAAWMDWSDAMRIHSANSCDQYGPLRVGPSFPFTSGGEALPAKPKGKWMFLRKNYYLPLWRFPAMQELARKELGLWNSGVSRLEAAMESVPSPKRQAALRQIYLGKYCSATVRTLINFRDFHKAMIDKDFSSALSAIADERENVTALIPVMDKDPSLGREPTMGVVTDREHLEWKLRQLAAKDKEIRSTCDCDIIPSRF